MVVLGVWFRCFLWVSYVFFCFLSGFTGFLTEGSMVFYIIVLGFVNFSMKWCSFLFLSSIELFDLSFFLHKNHCVLK